MDSKISDIIKIIIPDVNDEKIFQDSITCEYLNKLGNCTFEQILSEPLCLNDETRTLTEQTQELALANYRTFVETAECSNKIIKDFDVSKSALNRCLEKMPDFIKECQTFSSTSKEILIQRGNIEQIKYQSDQLLGLLELPVLMQETLNNSDYESALDLFTYIKNLSRKYNDLPALQTITSEITKLWFETLHRLFNQLRYDLPLTQCLQVLGYLRRANVVYESTTDDSFSASVDYEPNQFKSNKFQNVGDGLQLHFLKARGSWFDSVLSDAITDENDKHLRKIVEIHRIHLFNILTQHKAIFLSESQGSKLKTDDINGVAALSCWLKEKISKLMYIIESNIVQEDDASFESLLNQCMYLCLSFGRLGADMRGVMAPLFKDIISKNFIEAVSKADSAFETEMKQFKMAYHNKIVKKVTDDGEQNQNCPPEDLLEFYPLAEYTNNLLCALNILRVTVPLCLAQTVVQEMSYSLSNVSKVMASFHDRESSFFSEGERENFRSYCRVFREELIPHLQKCVNQIFPPTSIAEQLGVSITALQEEKIVWLDVDKICSTLNDSLSTKSE